MDIFGERARKLRKALREFGQAQAHLHEKRMDSFGTSGQEALRGRRELRWDGRRLIGDELPG